MITLDAITIAVEEINRLRDEVANREREITEMNKRISILLEETIPSIFQELEISEIKLEDGRKVSVKQDLYSALSEADKPKAYAWLDEHGYGGLIKTTLNVKYGKGDKEEAEELYEELVASGADVTMKEDVHHQTMKSFLNERVKEADPDFPLDVFKARVVFTAKIK